MAGGGVGVLSVWREYPQRSDRERVQKIAHVGTGKNPGADPGARWRCRSFCSAVLRKEKARRVDLTRRAAPWQIKDPASFASDPSGDRWHPGCDSIRRSVAG